MDTADNAADRENQRFYGLLDEIAALWIEAGLWASDPATSLPWDEVQDALKWAFGPTLMDDASWNHDPDEYVARIFAGPMTEGFERYTGAIAGYPTSKNS